LDIGRDVSGAEGRIVVVSMSLPGLTRQSILFATTL
jgi:hypothetical protein